MIHQLDNRMKVIRLREAVFSVPLTNFDKLVGPTFTQCQCVLPTLRRRITYQKSTIRRVDHLLVHLVPSDVSPIPFCLLKCAWSFRRNENTAKYNIVITSTPFVQDKDEWSFTCGVAVATLCSLKLTLFDP